MDNPKVSIAIVTWNHETFIADCLKSIYQQSWPNFSVIIVDNASIDETLPLIEKSEYLPTILRNPQNLGFAHGHNQAYALAKKQNAQALLVVNPDIELTPDFIEKIMTGFDNQLSAGSFAGKLFSSRSRETNSPQIIDSVGLKIKKSLQIVDRGADTEDRGQFSRQEEIFGVSGALALYRLSALNDIEIDGKIFDEKFFAYKEDADLACRLQLRGWKCVYIPTAEAYHYRRVHQSKSFFTMFKERKERPWLIKKLSYLNQFRLIIKDLPVINIIRYFPWLFLHEILKFSYLAIFETRLIFTPWQIISDLPRLLKTRRVIFKNAKVKNLQNYIGG